MKIYQFTYDKTDWVAGPNKEAIIQWYMNHTGFGLADMMEMDITVLPKNEWKDGVIVGSDTSEKMSFEQYILSMEPDTVEIIATTT
jgi:hypothetical protein